MAKTSIKKIKTSDPRSLEAAHFVMVFTTLPAAMLAAPDVLELYRFRWQIELAFKRLKPLLKLGRHLDDGRRIRALQSARLTSLLKNWVLG